MSFSVKATLLKNDILACPERGPSIAGPPSVPRFIELLLHEIARRILAGRDSSSICRTLSSRINALAGRFKADREINGVFGRPRIDLAGYFAASPSYNRLTRFATAKRHEKR